MSILKPGFPYVSFWKNRIKFLYFCLKSVFHRFCPVVDVSDYDYIKSIISLSSAIIGKKEGARFLKFVRPRVQLLFLPCLQLKFCKEDKLFNELSV